MRALTVSCQDEDILLSSPAAPQGNDLDGLLVTCWMDMKSRIGKMRVSLSNCPNGRYESMVLKSLLVSWNKNYKPGYQMGSQVMPIVVSPHINQMVSQ